MRDARVARSPAVRKNGGGAAVENGGWCGRHRERGRERGAVKSGSGK
jgi:hypothetical protein